MRRAESLFWRAVLWVGGFAMGHGHALTIRANRRLDELEERP